MAEFSVNPNGVGEFADALKGLSASAGSTAGTIQGIQNRVAGIKSLKGNGYPDKIDRVRRNVRDAGNELRELSGKAKRIKAIYLDFDAIVADSFSDFSSDRNRARSQNSKDISKEAASRAKKRARKRSFLNRLKDAFKGSLPSSKDIADINDFLNDFPKWRSKEGSKIANWIVDKAAKIHPALGNAASAIIEKVNTKYTHLEDMVKGVLDITNPAAVEKGAQAFAEELGFGWVPKVVKRLNSRTNEYLDKGGKLLSQGNVLQGLTVGLGGPLLAFGDMVVDTCVKTFKYVAKQHPVVDSVTKVIGVSKAITGKDAEGWVDTFFGSIGSGIKDTFDWLTA